MISNDGKIGQTQSPVQKRLIALAEKAGEIMVLVPSEQNKREKISEHLTVYSAGGPKLIQLWKIWRVGKQLLTPTTPPPQYHEDGYGAQRRLGTPPWKGGEEVPYDLITVQDAYFLGFLGYVLSRRFRVPLEIQVHGLERYSGLRVLVAKFVLQRAHKVRVVSERLKREMDVRFKIKDVSKIYELPVYAQIDAPKFAARRKTIPYPFTFLTVGRLVPIKNISLQIRAFAKVAKQIPHIRLRIVGDGPERTNLELEAKSLKLEASVVFEGYQKDVGRFYEEADAFLLTSDSEGWGLVALEAAAYKLPIIMTDVGLAQEVIKNDESGFIIPVGNERELILAMKDFLDKPELRARFGEAAFKAFKALPNTETQIAKQVAEWQTLVNRK